MGTPTPRRVIVIAAWTSLYNESVDPDALREFETSDKPKKRSDLAEAQADRVTIDARAKKDITTVFGNIATMRTSPRWAKVFGDAAEADPVAEALGDEVPEVVEDVAVVDPFTEDVAADRANDRRAIPGSAAFPGRGISVPTARVAGTKAIVPAMTINNHLIGRGWTKGGGNTWESALHDKFLDFHLSTWDKEGSHGTGRQRNAVGICRSSNRRPSELHPIPRSELHHRARVR